eukprot:4914834-Amphidinium_carterae.2
MEVEMDEAENNDDAISRLKESTLSYIVPMDGDTENDIKDLKTLQDIDDDLQSQTDLEHLARERREELKKREIFKHYAHNLT